MEAVALSGASLATAVWVGAIVFQSFIVAPLVFRALDEDSARRFLRAMFPRFYRLGLACGAIMIISLIASGSAVWAGARWVLGAVALMITAAGVSLWMVPQINAARDAGSGGQTRFRRLHLLSVLLTLLTLFLGVAVVIVLTRSGF